MFRRTWLKRLMIILPIIMLLMALGFVGWASTPAGTLLPSVEIALTSDEAVTVSTEPWLTFTPTEAASTGLVFYPGGRVLPEGYAPAMRAIAEAGYLVVVPAMPLNLAVFAPEKADEIIAAHLEITKWVIGGHSLGGSIAAAYAFSHRDSIDGMVLWAAYVLDSNSLAESTRIETAVVYASGDGLLNRETFDAALKNLPDTADVVIIEGGNHGQFGDYGDQDGDMPATISRAEQQAQAVEATVAVLARAALE
jgi:pimeloyl-ACP methyl ester carboxylesterase